MSSFVCEQCGASIIDTEHGYETGCEHYPPDLAYEEKTGKECMNKYEAIVSSIKEVTKVMNGIFFSDDRLKYLPMLEKLTDELIRCEEINPSSNPQSSEESHPVDVSSKFAK